MSRHKPVRLIRTALADDRTTVEELEVDWQELPASDAVRGGKMSRAALTDLSSDEPRWHQSLFEPGVEIPLHVTESIDYVCVISGSLEVFTPDHTIRLSPGDCVLQRCGEHGWRVIGDEPAVVCAMWFPPDGDRPSPAQRSPANR